MVAEQLLPIANDSECILTFYGVQFVNLYLIVLQITNSGTINVKLSDDSSDDSSSHHREPSVQISK